MGFLSGRASLTKKQKLQKYTCTVAYANGTIEAHMDGFLLFYIYIYMYLVMARFARSRFSGRSIGSIHDPVRHFLEATRRQNQSRINIQSDPR